MGKKRKILEPGVAPGTEMPAEGSLALPARKLGLGKKVVKIVVRVLETILTAWVSKNLRPGARRL